MKKLFLVLLVSTFVAVGLAAPKPAPGTCPECDGAAVSEVYVKHLTAYLESGPAIDRYQADAMMVLLELHKLRAAGELQGWQARLGDVIEERIGNLFEKEQIIEIFLPIKEEAPKSTYKALDEDGVSLVTLPICECAGSFWDCSIFMWWEYCCRRWQPWDACQVDPSCCGFSGMADCKGMCRDKDDC